MGKKNKNQLKNGNIDNKNPKDLEVQNKIQKKKSKKEKLSSNFVKCEKSKKNIFNDNEGQPSQSKDTTQLNNSTTIKPNKNSRKKDRTNKKIIFGDDDDEPREVSVNENVASSNKTSNPNYEEEPKDEEIDKFCDELDEEDNKQYENWIELLEAKLSSNKKKV